MLPDRKCADCWGYFAILQARKTPKTCRRAQSRLASLLPIRLWSNRATGGPSSASSSSSVSSSPASLDISVTDILSCRKTRVTRKLRHNERNEVWRCSESVEYVCGISSSLSTYLFISNPTPSRWYWSCIVVVFVSQEYSVRYFTWWTRSYVYLTWCSKFSNHDTLYVCSLLPLQKISFLD